MTNIPLKEKSIIESSRDLRKILLYGAGGVGKSVSLATILKGNPKKRLVYLMTERNAVSGLEFGIKKYNVIVKEGQIVYVYPQEEKKAAFGNLGRALENFANQSKVLALKGDGGSTQGKESYGYLGTIISTLSSFKGFDFVTGELVNIGNVGKLTSNDILIVDGLSPIGNEIWNSLVGDKIAISMTDYGPPQRAMYLMLSELAKLPCHVVLLAHARDKTDDKGSLIQVQVNTWVGNSNYETLMGLFTDVIYAYKFGINFYWSGKQSKVYAIARNIPAEDNLLPDFAKHNIFTET